MQKPNHAILTNRALIGSLRLNANNFTGSFPTELTSLDELGKSYFVNLSMCFELYHSSIPHLHLHIETLLLNDNLLTGSLPDTFKDLRNLNKLALHGCNFHGSVPPSLCSLVSGDLRDLTTDCEGDPPVIYCNCCSQCY